MSQMIPLHIADQAVAACEAEIQKLREENARLREAGDELQKDLKVQVWPWASHFRSIDQWNAAKEGKPHA